MKKEWIHGLDAAVTVCDAKGSIVYMNRKSVEAFAKDGGKKLIGADIFKCHTPESAELLKELMETQKEHIYTIEKKGVKKIIVQKPVFAHGNFDGFIEISIVLPTEMVHHKRD